MSRAEKKLRKLKAEEELARLQVEKKKRQEQERQKTKQQWDEMPSGVKRTLKIIGVIFVLILLISIFNPSDGTDSHDITQVDSSQDKTQENLVVEEKEMTPQDKMFADILELVNSKQAFDTGSYVKGDIPKGEYVFVSFEGSGKYYSEEDVAGNIIDNENFDSFGYVYVHDAGNVETQGLLVAVSALKGLGVAGAKDIYEKLNDTEDYEGAGWYKVGTDIDSGQYTIQSFGEAYVAVMSGPIGNNEIVNNNIFNGKYSVIVQDGQYLQISRGQIVQ